MFTSSLLTRAVEILHRHYAKIQKNPPFPPEEIAAQLETFGAVDDDDLRELRYEDLQDMGIPPLVARRMCNMFRGESATEAQQMVVRTVTDEVSELTHADLLERIAKNPTSFHAPAAEQLRARSRGKPCIVLTPQGKIDVSASAFVLEAIGQGEEHDETVRIDGSPRRLYQLEEAVNPIRWEHPVFRDSVLNLDGTDHLGIYWEDVSLGCRQLMRIAYDETHELTSVGREALCDLRDRAKIGGIASLAERYPKAHLRYEELRELNSLPALRTRLRRGRVLKPAG